MTGGLQIAALLHAYRSGRQTPTAVARAVLGRLDHYADPAVWISRSDPEQVMQRAAALQHDAAAARRLPLYGVPFAVKDNIDAAGLDTTAACPAFAYRPSRNATAVQRLLDAGAMLFGKTNLDQFATGLVGTRSPYGAPRCVFDRAMISGGSSSGSAVAVAAGLVSFSLGTDTAGSGRVPAGFNNIVGLKPTKGIVSTTGVVPACRSLDCVSVFASSASDARLVLTQLRGPDASDAFSRPDRRQRLPSDGLRVGVLANSDRVFCGDAEAEAIYDDAIRRLRQLGARLVTFDYAPFREAADLLYGDAFIAERLAAVGSFHAAQPEAMDPVVRDIIGRGAAFSAADAFAAQYRLAALSARAALQWRGFDVMLLPTSPTIFSVAELQGDPVGRNSQLGLYTNFVNLLDYAAIAVPAGFRRNGLPAGVTLIGPAFSDDDLALLAGRLHASSGAGAGLTREVAVAPEGDDGGAEAGGADGEDSILLAVAGAHLTGMPLNGQLVEAGARLICVSRTAPCYRLLALAGTEPAKPALVRTEGFLGTGLEIELWRLRPEAFGWFVSKIPAPMSIGKVMLADGRLVCGFLCEPEALAGAIDITAHGGWRAYLAQNGLPASAAAGPADAKLTDHQASGE